MVIKAIMDKNTERIRGVTIIGYEGVDKRIDVFAIHITYKAKVDELLHLDLAYVTNIRGSNLCCRNSKCH